MKDYTQIADKIESCADDGYTCNSAVVEACNIVFDPAFRRACEANTCGNYGRSWTCPPDVGDIGELIRQASSYKIRRSLPDNTSARGQLRLRGNGRSRRAALEAVAKAFELF